MRAEPWRIAEVSDDFATRFLHVDQRYEFIERVNSIMELPSNIPILIVVEAEMDVLATLWRLCKELEYTEDRVRFAAVAGLEQFNWNEVDDCVRRGSWLVLQGVAFLQNATFNVHTLMEHVNVDYISPEFRLWIVWNTQDHQSPPRKLLESCRSLYFETVHSAQDCFYEVVGCSEWESLLAMEQQPVPNELKLTVAASLLVCRIAFWDQLNVVIEVDRLIATLKSIFARMRLEDLEGWKKIVEDCIIATVQDSEIGAACKILDDILNDGNPDWIEAVRLIMQAWSSFSETNIDFKIVCRLVTSQELQTRRQRETSSRVNNFIGQLFRRK